MALRKAVPLTFRPKGVTDTIDGTNAAAGSMKALTNLVCAPHSPNMYVPRPAEENVFNFSSFNNALIPSALLVVGTTVWGMVPSSRFPGKDEPFCVDLMTGNNIPISGVTSANCPYTQPTIGDWVPPVIASFPSRMIVTHPGFATTGNFIGWIDISSFSSTALKGNITNGSPIIQSIQTPGGSSAPIISGVQPGQTISGPGIPAGTTVLSVTNGTFSENTTGDFTSGSAVVINIPSTTGMLAGMTVTGVGPATGAVILSVDSSTQITMSLNAISTAARSALDVSGGGTITISANATASTNAIALTIAGGTAVNPLWGSGNTNTNPLFSVPNCVAQFNGRAWYGVQNYAVFSDSLNPTQITNASQALALGDNSTPVTAMCGLPLTNQVTGGSLQSLVAFKGAGAFYQITGDQATSNLAQSVVSGSIGTLAPNTLCPMPLGIGFIAPDGFRILGLSGTLSDPIGPDGKGVYIPFANALYPSRMCAAFSQNTFRVTVQNNALSGQPFQEFWYDFDPKSWNGPHTFPHALLEGCDALSCFIGAGVGINGALWQSVPDPLASAIYVENGSPLTWTYETSLLPDNEHMAMNQVVETAIAMALSPTDTVTVTAADESGNVLGSLTLTGKAGPAGAVWGTAVWGAFAWGAAGGFFLQYAMNWAEPLVFKQMTITVTGTSNTGQAIGNLYMKYQICGYLLGDLE